ncbi:MAG: branched-chain amino acid aminotransferase [Bacilli bacterium]|nr:branched-chain amino acid aminotransferase [Bacilli bacterium]
MALEIKITLSKNKKGKPSKDQKLSFGKIFTDHMFLMNYTDGIGWHNARIEPYHKLELDPSCMVFHYGQEMFEGLKAFKTTEGGINLFRPYKNAKRAALSSIRLCIPPIPEDDFVQAVAELVKMEEDWIPTGEGESLYIRPFIIATDELLGVHPSKTYLFCIICSPSGSYYPNGLEPVSIWIEDEYVRAVRGGMGYAKTGGNYAASLIGQEKANKEGYAQVLWLDGVEQKYVEEVGAMNIFFKINGKLITPHLSGSILAGVVRDSVLQLANHFGIPTEERRISVDELVAVAKDGTLEEVFGTGTAAVISPIGKLRFKDEVFIINNGAIGATSQKLYDTLTSIQNNKIDDPFGWRYPIK